MKEIIAKLADFKDLSSAEMTDVIERIVTGRVTESQIVAFLLGLKMLLPTLSAEILTFSSPGTAVGETRAP